MAASDDEWAAVIRSGVKQLALDVRVLLKAAARKVSRLFD
jgi:hypothetical protein